MEHQTSENRICVHLDVVLNLRETLNQAIQPLSATLILWREQIERPRVGIPKKASTGFSSSLPGNGQLFLSSPSSGVNPGGSNQPKRCHVDAVSCLRGQPLFAMKRH